MPTAMKLGMRGLLRMFLVAAKKLMGESINAVADFVIDALLKLRRSYT